jgi:hypothetical protein
MEKSKCMTIPELELGVNHYTDCAVAVLLIAIHTGTISPAYTTLLEYTRI